MTRQRAPIKRTLTYTQDVKYGITNSIDNGFSTLHHKSPITETINTPTLKQLSFNSTPGKQLQNIGNHSKNHSALITNLDLELGDINLDNFTWKTYNNNYERADESFSVSAQKRTNSFNAIKSALDGEISGILPSRAKLREIRDFPKDPTQPIFHTTKNRRYPSN